MSRIAESERATTSPASDWGRLALFVAICLAAGGVGAWLTNAAVNTWYPTLQRPPLSPPNWIFGPVWTTLYVMMAIAAWLVWRRRTATNIRVALTLFAAQLVLNVAWSALFFYLQNPAAALVDIVALEATLVATAIAFRRIDSKAAALLLPYAAWVAFAAYLNAGFWWLNR